MNKDQVLGILTSYWDQGKGIWFFVDSMQPGVKLPEYIQEEYKGKVLVLLFNPSWPMDVKFDESNLYADLGFNGTLYRASLPYDAIVGFTSYMGDSTIANSSNQSKAPVTEEEGKVSSPEIPKPQSKREKPTWFKGVVTGGKS